MSLSQNYPQIKPTLLLDFANTKALDSRVTFTRASTATYYDGKTTAMAEQNLLTYSQDFDNAAWGKSTATVTANSSTAPDGNTTADTITASTGSGRHIEFQGPSATQGNVPYTFSVYLKQGTATFGTVAFTSNSANSTAWAAVVINLSTGVITQTTNGAGASSVSSSVSSAGNGWYRISITATIPNPDGAGLVGISDSGTPTFSGYVVYNWTAAGTETIYAWGAQLEQRSSVTAYTATTTAPITNYIPVLQTAASGVARFDNNPTTGESLGLLIEEQRTNLLTYSEQFDNAVWGKYNSTITANTVVAPDGTLNGDKLIESTASGVEHFVEQTISTTTNQTYTQSVYVQAGGTSSFAIQAVSVGASFTTSDANFSVSNGVITPSTQTGLILSSSAIAVGNGWYRCSIVYTLNGTVTSHRMRIYPRISGVYTGNGYSGIYIWGAQLEAGAFATSYIATTSAQVTRAADAASMTGTNFSSWYSINGGTLFGAYRIAFTFGTRYLLSLDQNNSNYVELAANNASNRVILYNRSGGTLDASITGSTAVSLTSLNQVAVTVANNDFTLYLNGTSQGTDTSVILAPTLASLEIGRYNEGSPGGYLNGTISKIAYYPARVTNTQLQALTS